jgi:MFS family permease
MKSGAAPRLSPTAWLICLISVIGFAFDTYQLLILPLVIKPALAALGGTGADGVALLIPGKPEYSQWARLLFFVPAIAGGVFGLLGGWLTDRFGRRRVLTASILIYAFGACANGLATTLPQFLIFRSFVFVGVCVEFVAAVAWLAELFPDAKQREKVLGFTQACSSFGGLMVAFANKFVVEHASNLPSIYEGHEAWRYTLISGLLPAIPLIFIRPFLPESPVWQQKKDAGSLKRPSLGELFAPALCRTTLISAIVFASCYGMAFGAIQHMPQIVPGMADVKAMAKAKQDAIVAKAESDGKPKPTPKALAIAGRAIEESAAAEVQKWQETGGLLGRVAIAIAAVYVVSRRALLRLFHVPALLFVPFFFWWLSNHLADSGNLQMVKLGIGLAGFLVVATFNFWGNYLPLVYPLHLRGTGESFAANIGGRVLGTSAAWFTFTFSASSPPNPAKIAVAAAAVAGIFALVGAVFTQVLPEPQKTFEQD